MGAQDEQAGYPIDRLDPVAASRSLDVLRRVQAPAARHRRRPRPRNGSTRSTRSSRDEGENRARFLMFKLLKRARQLHVGLPPLTQTRYINTISPEQEPFFPGDEELERRIRRIVRWNAVAMVLRANSSFTRASAATSRRTPRAATLYEVGFNHFFRGKDDDERRRPDLLPGPCRAGHLRAGLPRGPPDRGPARPLPARGRAGGGLSLVPASAADARLLGVPDGLDGPRPDQRDLPGAVQPLPRRTAASRTPSRIARVGVPRRRRDGRARVDRRPVARRPRGPRQPHLRRQLQPAAARRAGPRQRQDHPGARGPVPRRRLERHQGHLGPRVGRAPRPRRRRRPRREDERHARRRVPEVLGRRRARTSASTSSARTRACAGSSSTSPTTT